jgi:hypothetical protein
MTRPAWKGDPPRGVPCGADGGGGRVHDRGDRADLPGSGDGDGGRASGCPSGPRLRSGGCSRRGPGRSACRWRRGPGSEDISPASASSTGNPRPTVRPDKDTTDDAPGSRKTCDNPGWSSLCAFEDRGSSTRGLGAATPGPHSLLGTVGQRVVCLHRVLRARARYHAATEWSALRAEARPAVERGVRPGVKDPWIRKSPIQAPERNPRHLSARCSDFYVLS